MYIYNDNWRKRRREEDEEQLDIYSLSSYGHTNITVPINPVVIRLSV